MSVAMHGHIPSFLIILQNYTIVFKFIRFHHQRSCVTTAVVGHRGWGFSTVRYGGRGCATAVAYGGRWAHLCKSEN
jgi:hypothetical protein